MQGPREGGASPWGTIQSAIEAAPGIVWVSTAGHGGIWLSSDRVRALPVKGLNTYGGGCWFEEDCEWAIVVLAFGAEAVPHRDYLDDTPEVRAERNRKYLDAARRTAERHYPALLAGEVARV